MARENLLKEINFLANSKGVDAFIRGRLESLHREVRNQAYENERLRAALYRAYLWLSTSGMEVTASEIEAECVAALEFHS